MAATGIGAVPYIAVTMSGLPPIGVRRKFKNSICRRILHADAVTAKEFLLPFWDMRRMRKDEFRVAPAPYPRTMLSPVCYSSGRRSGVMPKVAENAAAKIQKKIHNVPRVTSIFAEVVDDGIDAAKRVGKHTSDATEELMDDTVNRVKRHPVESLVMVFALGFIFGALVDWRTRRK
jgi:hypothetical protein